MEREEGIEMKGKKTRRESQVKDCEREGKKREAKSKGK